MSPTESSRLDPSRVTTRLQPIRSADDLHPLRCARHLAACFLYWIPVRSFPVPAEQRRWLLLFLDRLTAVMRGELGLRSEVFLQMKVIDQGLMETLAGPGRDFMPMMGLGRRPGAPVPRIPRMDDIRAAARADPDGFDYRQHLADYHYWFLDDSERDQRKLFFGYGGLTLLGLPPAPAPPPAGLPNFAAVREHPAAQMFDFTRLAGLFQKAQDPFQRRSKELFGAGIESDLQFQSVPFVLPVLASADFFNQPGEQVRKWFDLFPVYIRESPGDQGMILASQTDLHPLLKPLLREMSASGLAYREA